LFAAAGAAVQCLPACGEGARAGQHSARRIPLPQKRLPATVGRSKRPLPEDRPYCLGLISSHLGLNFQAACDQGRTPAWCLPKLFATWETYGGGGRSALCPLILKMTKLRLPILSQPTCET